MIDILLIAGLGAFQRPAGMAERPAPTEFWLPTIFGADTILAYAGFADVTAMSVNS